MQIYAIWPKENIVTIWLHDLNHVVFKMTNCSQWSVMDCSDEWKLFVPGDRVQKFRGDRRLAREPGGKIYLVANLLNNCGLFKMSGYYLNI